MGRGKNPNKPFFQMRELHQAMERNSNATVTPGDGTQLKCNSYTRRWNATQMRQLHKAMERNSNATVTQGDGTQLKCDSYTRRWNATQMQQLHKAIERIKSRGKISMEGARL